MPDVEARHCGQRVRRTPQVRSRYGAPYVVYRCDGCGTEFQFNEAIAGACVLPRAHGGMSFFGQKFNTLFGEKETGLAPRR